MKSVIIDGIDFWQLDIQKYWQPPSSWTNERRKTEVRNRIFSGDYFGARKYDGAFYEFIKDMDGNCYLIGRSQSTSGDFIDKLDRVPHIQKELDKVPNGTVLLGEIVWRGDEGAKRTVTIMNCLPEKAIARQKEKPIDYYLFDCLCYDGHSMLREAAQVRVGCLNTIKNNFGKDFHNVFVAEYYEGQKLWNELQNILGNGGEGIVLLLKSGLYEPGKRPSATTMKVKKELAISVDCVVIGVNPPTHEYTGKEITMWQYWENVKTGELLNGNLYQESLENAAIQPVTKNWYYQWPGSFKLGLYKDGQLTYFGDLSGLSDYEKENAKDYIGKVAEVKGMEIDSESGHIRHPKLIRFRDDKPVKECTWEQVF